MDLSHVCRYWRELMLSNAHTWSDVHISSDRPRNYAAIFARSWGVPLRLYVYLSLISNTPQAVKAFKGMKAAIHLFSQREEDITQLSFDFDYQTHRNSTIVQPLLCGVSFPNLTHLEIRNRMVGLEKFSLVAPKLEHLLLQSIEPEQWSNVITERLVFLSLVHYRPSSSAGSSRRIPSVCELLNECTRLKHCTIEWPLDVFPPASRPPVMLRVPVTLDHLQLVQLPHLQLLMFLECAPLDQVRSVELRLIKFPAALYLHERLHKAFFNTQHLGTIRELKLISSQARLAVSSQPRTASHSDVRMERALEVPERQLLPTIQWLTTNYASFLSELKALTIDTDTWNQWAWSRSDVSLVFKRLTHLTLRLDRGFQYVDLWNTCFCFPGLQQFEMLCLTGDTPQPEQLVRGLNALGFYQAGFWTVMRLHHDGAPIQEHSMMWVQDMLNALSGGWEHGLSGLVVHAHGKCVEFNVADRVWSYTERDIGSSESYVE